METNERQTNGGCAHRPDCVNPTIERHGISGMCPVASGDFGSHGQWVTAWKPRPEMSAS